MNRSKKNESIHNRLRDVVANPRALSTSFDSTLKDPARSTSLYRGKDEFDTIKQNLHIAHTTSDIKLIKIYLQDKTYRNSAILNRNTTTELLRDALEQIVTGPKKWHGMLSIQDVDTLKSIAYRRDNPDSLLRDILSIDRGLFQGDGYNELVYVVIKNPSISTDTLYKVLNHYEDIYGPVVTQIGLPRGIITFIRSTIKSRQRSHNSNRYYESIQKEFSPSYIRQVIREELEVVLDEKKKKAGTESSKESSLRDWFGRKGAKGKKKGWVDCNAPDGKGGYKSCGRSSGEGRKKYPACRPTPGACKERGKGKSWGKKSANKKKE